MISMITNLLENRRVWILFFVALLMWSASPVDWVNLTNEGAGSAIRSIVGSFLAPDLSPKTMGEVIQAMWITLAYAVTALSLAIFFGLPLGLIASGVLSTDQRFVLALAVFVRAYLGIIRSIHELIWALLFVSAFGLSPAAGIIAIALPYSGIIGRIFAERLQDVPEGHITACQVSGASGLKLIALARIPTVLPDTISYLFYRFECAIRTASVLSFIGLGGIGFQVHIAMSDLKFETVATLFYSLLALILIVGLIGRSVRKRLLT